MSWREALVIPIPKPGKDASDPANYRPIALTSCLCKTLERIVSDRLVWFLEKNNLIVDVQSGFRRQRGTIDHLVCFETFVREAFINRQHIVSVFFDLESAYDTTWTYGILKYLHDFGLRGRLPLFSSPEHEVLMVSYCDRAVSIVRHPSSTFYLVYALEATVLVGYS